MPKSYKLAKMYSDQLGHQLSHHRSMELTHWLSNKSIDHILSEIRGVADLKFKGSTYGNRSWTS